MDPSIWARADWTSKLNEKSVFIARVQRGAVFSFLSAWGNIQAGRDGFLAGPVTLAWPCFWLNNGKKRSILACSSGLAPNPSSPAPHSTWGIMTNASWRVERLVEAFQSLSWPSAGRTVSWSLRCLHYFGIEVSNPNAEITSQNSFSDHQQNVHPGGACYSTTFRCRTHIERFPSFWQTWLHVLVRVGLPLWIHPPRSRSGCSDLHGTHLGPQLR